MCVSPTFIYVEKGPTNERLEVPCGWCWACRKNRVNDLVGRCLCEASESDWLRTCTLTYDDKKSSTLQTSTLVKADFQLFMKKLRKNFKTRYLVAGEHGSKSGRAHFHVILFGRGTPPSWDLNKMTDIHEWPWGHCWVDDSGDEKSIRYICKYLMKSAKRKKTRFAPKYSKEWISYSRIPIMGLQSVLSLAEQYSDERLFPHNFKYTPPNSQSDRTYSFTGKARYLFLDHLFKIWPQAMDLPKTEVMHRAVLRYVKQKQRIEWDQMTVEEQKKYLDLARTSFAKLDHHKLRKLTRQLIEGIGTDGQITKSQIAQFLSDPHNYAYYQNTFKRDITLYPPTGSEVGRELAQRFAR